MTPSPRKKQNSVILKEKFKRKKREEFAREYSIFSVLCRLLANFHAPKKWEKNKDWFSFTLCIHQDVMVHYADNLLLGKRSLEKVLKRGSSSSPKWLGKKRVSFNIETLQISCCLLWRELLLGYTISIPICVVFASCCNCVAKQFQLLWGDWNFYMVCVCVQFWVYFSYCNFSSFGGLLNGW